MSFEIGRELAEQVRALLGKAQHDVAAVAQKRPDDARGMVVVYRERKHRSAAVLFPLGHAAHGTDAALGREHRVVVGGVHPPAVGASVLDLGELAIGIEVRATMRTDPA